MNPRIDSANGQEYAEHMPRLFLALPLSDTLQNQLVAWQLLNATYGVRMTAPENLHVTAAFFGNVVLNNVGLLTAALKTVCAMHRPFDLTVERIIPFPQEHPTMWWASCELSEAFTMFAEDARNAAITFAPECDRKMPIPHITLARFRLPPPEILEPQHLAAQQKIRVTYCDLMESQLSETGPRFIPQSRLPLQPS